MPRAIDPTALAFGGMPNGFSTALLEVAPPRVNIAAKTGVLATRIAPLFAVKTVEPSTDWTGVVMETVIDVYGSGYFAYFFFV